MFIHVPLSFYFTNVIKESLEIVYYNYYFLCLVLSKIVNELVCKNYCHNNKWLTLVQTDFESNCPLITMINHKKSYKFEKRTSSQRFERMSGEICRLQDVYTR